MSSRTSLSMGYIWFQIVFGTNRGNSPVRGVILGQLDGYAHEKEQRLRKLRVMNGGGSHDLVSIGVGLPLADEMVGIWSPGKLMKTHKRCGVAISRSPAFRND